MPSDLFLAEPTASSNAQAEFERTLAILIPLAETAADSALPPLKKTDFKPPFSLDPPTVDAIRRWSVLESELPRFREEFDQSELALQNDRRIIITQLISLVSFLSKKPYPVVPKIARLLKPDPVTGVRLERKELRAYRALQSACQENQRYLTLIPPYFAVPEKNQRFLREVVDLAISTRTQTHPYFERLAIEEVLYRFFESRESPLMKKHQIPFTLTATFEAVSAWIESAASTVADFDGIGTMERRMVFYIFLARFLFDRTFPQFEFKPRADPVLIEKMQKIGDSLADLKISEEAVNWMRQSQFVSCPIDASHCLHLVLKSMEMPAPSDSADDYFAAMAEHNISSQILVALMCRAPLVDPPGFVKYLKHWSRLPGFSGRCIAAISFLESAVEMIEGFAV